MSQLDAPIRILLIDPDPLIRSLLRALFERQFPESVSIDEVSSFKQKSMETINGYDLIVTELVFPNENTKQLLNTICAIKQGVRVAVFSSDEHALLNLSHKLACRTLSALSKKDTASKFFGAMMTLVKSVKTERARAVSNAEGRL